MTCRLPSGQIVSRFTAENEVDGPAVTMEGHIFSSLVPNAVPARLGHGNRVDKSARLAPAAVTRQRGGLPWQVSHPYCCTTIECVADKDVISDSDGIRPTSD